MLFPPPEAASPDTVKLIGPIVQWATAFLLLGVFGLLIPLGSQRRALGTWMIAFSAQVICTSWQAAWGLVLITGQHHVPFAFSALQGLDWPAKFVFLAAVCMAAAGAAERWLSPFTHWAMLTLAGLLGWLLSTAGSVVANRVELFATIVSVFAVVLILIWNARGTRRPGTLFLAGALSLYAVLATMYLLPRSGHSHSLLMRIAMVTYGSAGYGDAIGLAIIACAAIVVMVQEAFIETRRADIERIAQAAASEHRLSAIIHAAHEPIVTLNSDGLVDLVNTAAEELLGASRVALLGRQFDDLLTDYPGNQALRIQGTDVGQIVRADGTSLPVEYTRSEFRNDGMTGVVIVMRDLTERLRAEARAREFDRRVAEAEKTLAIGRVVSGVAHELNNPLAVVLGQSEQLASEVGPGDVQTGLALIHEQAHRARHIVRDLLAFVRNREEARDAVSIARVIERVVVSQRSEADRARVKLTTDLPKNLPDVWMDRVAIEQVLVNLIDNAIVAAGPNGDVRIKARAVGKLAAVVIEDTGPGVPAELVDRIFEPFFTTKRPGHGTGLGLTVSRELVQQNGGTLIFANRPEPGVGARFVMSLPLSEVAASPAALHPRPFPAPPPGSQGRSDEVLIIDDESSVRITLGKMFSRAGWHVRYAADGEEGLRLLETLDLDSGPAVVLCDLKMPGMSGQDVYRQCLERWPRLAERFVFVTGDVVEPTSSKFVVNSGREVVEKPFTVAEIAQVVERTVGGLTAA